MQKIFKSELQYKRVLWLTIGFLWLVHLSAVIGINLGYEEWFITKTPFNLLLIFVSMLLLYPLTEKRSFLVFLWIFLGGMIAEIIGVNTGLLFGDYVYAHNLGPKIGGVPILIGINWAVLVICGAEIANQTQFSLYVKAAIGALLMVLLDFLIEPLAPGLGFWSWTTPDAPLFNYITWFVLAFLLNVLFLKSGVKGNKTLVVNIYLTQLVFFGSLYVTKIL